MDSIAELGWASFDSLNPYEVAVLAFTLPASIDDNDAPWLFSPRGRGSKDVLVLTGKAAYLWAGSVAHVLVRNPSLGREEVLGFFRRALSEVAPRARQALLGSSLGSAPYFESGVALVDAFLNEAGLPSEEISAVRLRTADAIRSLEWRGLIEDPFSKRVRNLVLSVALVMPVGYTSTGPNEQEINALTWVYKAAPQGDQTKRDFHFKVREISHTVLDELVPEVASLAGKLSGNDSALMPNVEAQQDLKTSATTTARSTARSDRKP